MSSFWRGGFLRATWRCGWFSVRLSPRSRSISAWSARIPANHRIYITRVQCRPAMQVFDRLALVQSKRLAPWPFPQLRSSRGRGCIPRLSASVPPRWRRRLRSTRPVAMTTCATLPSLPTSITARRPLLMPCTYDRFRSLSSLFRLASLWSSLCRHLTRVPCLSPSLSPSLSPPRFRTTVNTQAQAVQGVPHQSVGGDAYHGFQ